jgi:hypothetical protein
VYDEAIVTAQTSNLIGAKLASRPQYELLGDVRFSKRPVLVKHFQAIHHLGESTSLAGSRFSPESAPGPFHHGIRGRGGTIFGSALPSE